MPLTVDSCACLSFSFLHSFSLIQVNHLSTSEKINWHKQLSVSSLWPGERMRMLQWIRVRVPGQLSRVWICSVRGKEERKKREKERVHDDTLLDQKQCDQRWHLQRPRQETRRRNGAVASLVTLLSCILTWVIFASLSLPLLKGLLEKRCCSLERPR